ncbi:hypothetical protein ACLB90_06310 [Stenotrophomonas sp. LGBM10]|uniref:hypothetical protein n=1 Tax=Stenotrophomonas sp. LGBM10 TaxID=3390038 RepID=UPI00398AA9C6
MRQGSAAPWAVDRRGIRARLRTLAFRITLTTVALAGTGCVDGPGIGVELKALGDSPLAGELSRQWMNREPSIARNLQTWLQTRPDSAACLASESCLRDLGFQRCAVTGQDLSCHYEATMPGTLLKGGGERRPLQIQLRVDMHSRQGAITALDVARSGFP